MFHGGGPPTGRYPREYAPHYRISTPFDQPQGPSTATGFGPQVGPVPYRSGVPCGPFVPPQYERHPFPYHGNSEECRGSSSDRSYPSPGPGNNQGPCGGPPGENIGRQLNPPLPCDGFSVDQLSQFPDSRKVNSLSQEDIENERAGEAFLRCLATKEKYPVRDLAGDPHFRSPRPGNGPELGTDDQACKRQILGRSKSRPRGRSRSRGKSMGRSKSRPRSRSCSRGKSMGRSKSRPRSRSCSRGKSMGRSKSRPRSRSRSRGKSMGRSKSRPPSPSRAKSVGRSKSRPRSRSRSRVKSPGKNCSQGAGCDPSRSCSGTSSSSSSSCSIPTEGTSRTAPPAKKTAMDMFRELLLASQLKEREELLASSRMAALKKQLDTAGHSQVSAQTRHSPVNILGEHQSSSLPREMQSILSAVTRGMEPSFLASIQGQMREGQWVPTLREDFNLGQYEKKETFGSVKQETEEENDGEFLLPHEKVRHDRSGFSRILGVMGNVPDPQEKRKIFTDIEDEEKFLYGDEDDKGKATAKAVAGEKQAVVDFDKIKKALTTIGLDLGKAEISKMMARRQEHTAGSPRHKGTSSSGGLSPGQSRSQKRNRSPNSDIYSNSYSSAKQALYCGASPGLVGTEFDTSSQEKKTGGIPFFRPDTVHEPLLTTNMQTSPLGSETAIWGPTQLNMANYLPQKPNVSVPHGPGVDLQIPGLESLKQVLESVKATSKGSDNLVDLANQSSHVRNCQREKISEENSKVKEEALKTDVQEQIKRKDYLLKELESLLKREVSEFVVPVIGFCCQLCEEFFGDVTSAQDHAACQSHKERRKKHVRAHNKSGGNLQARPAVDTERRNPRESGHKWSSKEEPRGSRGTVEKVSVKEDQVDLARPANATPSKMADEKGMDSTKSSVTDHREGVSSKAHKKKKKKKKEKKRLKKEKKRQRKGKD
ncbi:hypothetical protein COCON_G00225140 [Conger conger]|uniref:C2H2-type domain-containing protein n=1 Tax=Conger conger TaxID=82655 RepID=A0A9Q1HMZ4_CONCO|nr:hypothetical protein COCON_G00225140 [Conger conger]